MKFHQDALTRWAAAMWIALIGVFVLALPHRVLAQSVPILEARLILPHDYGNDTEKGVWSALITPDGSTVVSYYDKVIRIWNGKSGAKIRDLVGHEAEIRLIRMNSDGRLVASVARDNSLRVWDIASGRLVRDFGLRESRIWELGFTREGTLVTFDADAKITVLKLSDGSVHHAFALDRAAVRSFKAFNADGTRLLLANPDKTLTLYDVGSGRLLATHGESFGDKKTSGKAAFSRDGTMVVYLWTDGKVHTWRVAATSEEDDKMLFDPPTSVSKFAFSPDGKWLLVGLSERSEKLNIQVRDARTGELRGVLHGHDSTMDMAFSADSRTLVSAGGYDSTVRVWELPHAAPAKVQAYWERHARDLKAAGFGKGDNLRGAFAYSPDGKTLASQGFSEIALWDMERRELRKNVKTEMGFKPLVNIQSAFVSDRLLYTLMHDKSVRLWDIESGKVLNSQIPEGEVTAERFSLGATGKSAMIHLARNETFSHSGVSPEPNNDGFDIIEVRSTLSGELRSRFEVRNGGSAGWFLNAVYDDASNTVIGCLRDDTLAVYDAASGKQLRLFERKSSGLRQECVMALSKDGATLAEGSSGVRVWDTKTGRELFGAFTGHKEISALALSPDSKTLVVGAIGYGERDGLRSELMTLEAFAIPSGRRLYALPAFVVGDVASIAFHPSGKSFVTLHTPKREGPRSGVQVWNTATGEPLPSSSDR
jgi:WD40 repeat protein